MIYNGSIDVPCHGSSTLCCQRNAAEDGEELQDLLQMPNFIMLNCKSDVQNMHHGQKKPQIVKHPVWRSSHNRTLPTRSWCDNIKTDMLWTPK